jgi:cobalt-zinc-cadmium resistance protein CzcA
MPRIESLRSVSQFGISQVIVTFKDGTDVYFARQQINERLLTVELPPGIGRPEMGPVSTGLGEVFHYMLVPKLVDESGLKETKIVQDWTIKPGMRTVPGTAEINTWGGLSKQYQVRVDPNKLVKYGLSFDQVTSAVPENKLNVGGGSIAREGDAVLVHGVGRTVNVQQIENIVITAKEGVPIRVRDVGDVVIHHEIRRGVVTANGEGEVVLGMGYMLMGENSYAVTTRLREKLDEIKPTLPSDMKVETLYDRTHLVDQVITTVKNNLSEGAYLVVVILFLLLGSLRAGLVAAMAIPLSMLFGFCGMWGVGIAASLLSLGAIDFGIVVDSSVVVIENIIRRLGHSAETLVGKARLDAIREATAEVRGPAVFGQLIIMIVYLPILTLEGVEGKMFRPMALTVIFILIGSLILSLTATPVLASLFLPRKIVEKDVILVRFARWLYRPTLSAALRMRWGVVGVAAVLLMVTLGLASRMGSEFVPRLSEGDLVIGIIRAPGTSLERSGALNAQMEKMLLAKFPDEISHVWSRVGAPAVATDAGNLEMTDMFVALKPRKVWKKAKFQSDLVPLIEVEVNQIKGQVTYFTQPIEQRINEMVSGVRADVALKLFGKEFDRLIPKSAELQKVLQSVPGCSDLTLEQVSGQPILRIAINQDAIARYGVPARAVLDLVESIGSKSLGEVIEGQLRFPLVVRLPETYRTDPMAIGSILLSGPAGEQIPLSRVADIQQIVGPKMITREFGQRRITVQCNVRGRDIGSFVAEAREKISREVKLDPKEFRIEWGGQFENMQRAQQRLTIVVPLALLLIVALLYLSYRNGIDTAFVFVSVPFACVGGIWSLTMREMPLSISAAVGFITLSGVSVLNGMVFVSALRQELSRGLGMEDAIRTTALHCLRTIIMTALVASVGFVPMALSQGVGAEVQRPLATVVIGGVITSTLFTLFALPVLYRLLPGTKPTMVAEAGLSA